MCSQKYIFVNLNANKHATNICCVTRKKNNNQSSFYRRNDEINKTINKHSKSLNDTNLNKFVVLRKFDYVRFKI